MSDLGSQPPCTSRLAGTILDTLCQDDLIAPSDAAKAIAIAQAQGLSIQDVLIHQFSIPALTIAQAQAHRLSAQFINPIQLQPDSNLVDRYGPMAALKNGLLPWRRLGGAVVILASDPDNFAHHQNALTTAFGPVRMAVTTQDMIASAVQNCSDLMLAHSAENAVAGRFSSREWRTNVMQIIWATIIVGLGAMFYLFGGATLVMLSAITVTLLVINSIYKAAAVFACVYTTPDPTPPRLDRKSLPKVTILVPLFRETEIARHLLTRLQKLNYPRDLLDVCLVTESDDATTRATLGQATLPLWLRAIVVPQGTLRTKPRALNYAMNFAKGSIIGVYDAEDAPDPDQLLDVAATFAARPRDVACLQGVLDYYNSASNWLTRCFTIEYAAWFRVILPGFQRLGLVVPLGGTTLFFRRDILEELGGWDAHNVTEDADLGIRLARFGYRTELIQTVTQEEANGRFWPWIKQRSRWLKGYAITYAVHMRNPARLWRDLGAFRFWGVQVLFAGTLAQFLLAPVLWTFWIVPFGLTHPFVDLITPTQFWLLIAMFFASEAISLWVMALALYKARKVWLVKWALSLLFYFPLASIGAYKGLLELAWKPYYWDKTTHGVLLPPDEDHS